MNKPVTLFSFGYWGWGTSTRKLVDVVDAIEKKRGFKPPIFVDTRMNRQVRAPGFNGAAFGGLVGHERYWWMNALGNRSIKDGEGGIQIEHPKAAHSLLDLALHAAEDKQRVIFFCACERQKTEGIVTCHRWEVGKLVLRAAKDRHVPVEIVEWPGGKPRELEFEVTAPVFKSICNGARSIPLPPSMDPAGMGGPAWGTVATIKCGDEFVRDLVGHVSWAKNTWHVQIVGTGERFGKKDSVWSEEARRLCQSEGWVPRHSD
jgi:hypothetical protein